MPCSVWNGAFSYSKAEMVTVYIYYCFLRQLSQRKHPPSSQLSSPLIFLQKHYVHNITVVHVDGGEGGVRAPALGQCRRQPGALKNHSPDGFSPPHAPAAPFSSLPSFMQHEKETAYAISFSWRRRSAAEYVHNSGFFESHCSNLSSKSTPLRHGKSGAVFAVFHLFLQNLLPILHVLILVSILGVFAYASLSNFAFFAVFTPDFAFAFIWRHKRVNRALFINNMICSL